MKEEQISDYYRTQFEKAPDDLNEAMIQSTMDSGYKASLLVSPGSRVKRWG